MRREALRRLLAARALVDEEALRPDTPLGPGGLGLDSVALVELLLEVERLSGREVLAAFLHAGVLTVGALEAAAAGSEREPRAGEP